MATYTKSINLIKVADGANGINGTSITIKNKSVTYQISSNGSTPPSGTWNVNVPDISLYPEQFLWTKTEVEYSDGQITTSYSVSYIAKDGEDGKDGTNGINGQNGRSLYTWVAYADDEKGTGAVKEPGNKKYIGFSYNQRFQDFDLNEPDIREQFVWSLYTGHSGEDGIGVISIRQLFMLTDNATVIPSLPQPPLYFEWEDTNPEWQENKYLWLTTEYLYSNGEVTFTAPYTDNNWKIAQDAVSNKYDKLEQDIKTLQDQIDSVIETWYMEGAPDINNPPWGDVAENHNHIGDLYYDLNTGLSYRFFEKENGIYEWKPIADSDIQQVLDELNKIKDELDSNISIYLEEPADPQINDLWLKEDGYFYQYTAEGNWILANNGVQTVEVQYAKNQSNTYAPADSEFTTTSPSWESGYHIWQRTVVKFADGKVDKSEPVCISAASAKGIVITGEQVFKGTNGENVIFTPESITLVAQVQGDVKMSKWYYKDANGVFQVLDSSGNNVLMIEPTQANIWHNNTATIKAESSETSYYDIISLYKIYDGRDGAAGKDGEPGKDGKDGENGTNGTNGQDGKDGTSPYLVYLTNENITFAANSAGLVAAKTATSQVMAFHGTESVLPTIGSISGVPSGMNVTNSNGTITITVGDNTTLGTTEEASGTINISVTSPIKTTLKIYWSKVKSGADGETKYTWIKYADDASGKNMSDNPTGKKYMGIAYNKSTQEESSLTSDYTWSLIQGADGADGKDGEKGQDGASVEILNEEVRYALSESPTSRPTVWNSEIPTELPQGWYLWTRVVITYTGDKSTTAYSVTYLGKDGQQGEQGPQGEPGKDGVDATSYYLEANQPNILKFSESNNDIAISPEVLILNIYKSNSSSESGRDQVGGLVAHNLKIRVFYTKKGEWYDIEDSIKNQIVELNSPSNSLNINLLKFWNLEEQISDAWETFKEEECIFGFYYTLNITEEGKNESYNLSTFVDCKYGMTKDMAKFSQNAASINASIQSTKLKFSANGLEVVNGGFQIKNNENTQVFYADENGNLIIKGMLDACGGSFSGDISAASGNFSGTITGATGNFAGDISAASGTFKGGIEASSGLIGGFKIGASTLVSTDNESSPSITLDGASGKIYAQNIELGTGAVIKDYIQLGSGKVTLNNASKFLTVKQNVNSDVEVLTMNDEGIITVGNGINTLYIDGANGSITSSNYNNGLGWKISSTESIFNDVTVRGSIRASVLEYGEVQTVGGALIVRPSSMIKNIEDLGDTVKITLVDTTGFEVGDWCLINKDTIKIWSKITSKTNDSITVNQTSNPEIGPAHIGHPIVSMGVNGSVGIGVNGSTNSALIAANSLSVFSFDETEKKLVSRIILGKLPDAGYGFASGTYGLYAENVLLKGSLVTQTEATENQSPVYSGISTLYSGADSPASHAYKEWFGDTTGEILLWAGAKSTDKADVEKSKFFVDKNGNLVAHSGYFKGTIITDATITASEIHTAVITGVKDKSNDEDYALTIRDAANGIVFRKGEEAVFSLSEDSIKAKVPQIILNDNFIIRENGEVVVSNLFLDGFKFNQGKILYSSNFNGNDLSGDFNTAIDFNNGIIISPSQSKQSLIIDTNKIRLNDTVYMTSTVKYGVNDNMKYEPVYENEVLIGYDLYID